MEVFGRTHDSKSNRYRTDSSEQRSPQVNKESQEKHLLEKYDKKTKIDLNVIDSGRKGQSENFFDIEEDVKHMTLKRERNYPEIEKNPNKNNSCERKYNKDGVNTVRSVHFHEETYPPAIEIDLSSSLSYKILEKNESPEKGFKNQNFEYECLQKEFQSPNTALEEAEKKHKVIVSQYESVLKILNEEFKALMSRNEELESQLETANSSSQRKDFTESFDFSSDEIRRQFINEKLELQKKVEILEQREVPSLRKEKEELINQLNHKSVIVEEIKREHQSNQIKIQAAEEMNKQLKDELMAGKVKIDELQSKLSLIERA